MTDLVGPFGSFEPAEPVHPFDLPGFQAQPRLTAVAASADGSRAVVVVSALDHDGSRFRSALWSVDPAGGAPARRLTRSGKGESAPVFTPAGDVLFLSSRPSPGDDDDTPTGLWALPAGGGEARRLLDRPGGVGAVAVAREAGTVVVVASTLGASTDEAADAEVRETRKKQKITAILHEGAPVRYWDADLGPGGNRLFAAVPGERDDDAWTLRDLTGDVGRALDHAEPDLSSDGLTVVTAWEVPDPDGSRRARLAAVDVATGAVRVLAEDDEHEFTSPRISPDGRTVAALRERRTTPTRPPVLEVVTVPLTGGPVTVLTEGWDGWPHALRWTPEGDALVVVADLRGSAPLFRVAVHGDAAPQRLTPDHGAYGAFSPLPGGRVLALRDAVDAPPAPVVVAGDAVMPVPGPAGPVELPGRLEQVETTAEDGTPLRAWLVLPAGASESEPAPLALFVHGGPLGSWNAWSWRWSPWLLARRGWAVVLPDPALSTGYGQHMIERGWGAWGAAPYTDVMALTDAALARPEVDASRVAALGGSFGGYMANWIAGHTDRFAAVVTHASLWNLETFGAITDAPWYWRRELTAEACREFSPHRFADGITTPMLVIHGDKDYRVPIGEGLALWWALQSDRGTTDPSPHRFLYFPDENHWVLTPHHAELWYETVFAFLDHHVLGRPWERPGRLG